MGYLGPFYMCSKAVVMMGAVGLCQVVGWGV